MQVSRVSKCRRALVTGASRGIGLAIAEVLSKHGVELICPTRQELDLSSRASIRQYISGLNVGVDILINNAGINELASIDELEENVLLHTLEVNLVSNITLAKLLLPYMKAQKYGRILNISSIWSEYSKPRRLMYSTSKAAINGFTRSLAVEVAGYNVLVNAIAPGFVNTELTRNNNSPEEVQKISAQLPIQRLIEPSEIGQLAYFLTSEQNSCVTGQVIFADGGFSCV